MSKKPAGSKKTASEETKTSAPSATSGSPAIDDLGTLPRTYGNDTIFLVAQEPHWLFTYWDIDISLHPGGKTFLRVLDENGATESEIEVPFETKNWYIPVNTAGSSYSVEIGYLRGSQWNSLATSVAVRTPPDKISDSSAFDYATLPLHMSFQRLMDNIHSTIQNGETLIQALARLQKEGRLLPETGDFAFRSGSDEYLVLEALIGKELLDEMSSASLSSEELSSRIRMHLEERLSSAQASELVAREWGAPESSLFSAVTALTGTSSWSPAALSSWAAAALTSWAAAAQGSWTAGPGQSSAALSSWPTQSLSSWLQAATSSWPGAGTTSWSQAALSSWSAAATSSWGGSENVGSFGMASREFFMHVNAEVIFYGGTHPQAKVTIDGKPVRLNPDGTFRHHFIFPDGTYEIPITATSPDGVETRSAMLKFDRATARTGDVGHTAQPPLAAPMGAKS